MKRFLSILVMWWLAATAAAQMPAATPAQAPATNAAPSAPQAEAPKIRFRKLPQETIDARLKAAMEERGARKDLIEHLFQEAGCAADELSEDRIPHVKLPNVICVVPGKSERQIVVGAHYDYRTEGHGIVDNWSGASLLPSLLESLKVEPREHTFVFIAFAGEEDGMLGSKSYVQHLDRAQREKIDAMVNLDTLGLGPTKVWASASSKPLVNALFNVAAMLHSPLAVMNVDGAGDSDNSSFRDAKIPEICIHSVMPDTIGILHTYRDQISAIRRNDYYESYHLLVAYLAMMDARLDATHEIPKK